MSFILLVVLIWSVFGMLQDYVVLGLFPSPFRQVAFSFGVSVLVYGSEVASVIRAFLGA